MLRKIMHKRERYFALLNDNRVVHPFGWGEEFIGEEKSDDPHKLFSDYSKRMVENSEEFYRLPDGIEYFEKDFDNEGIKEVSWESGVTTPSIENNTVTARYFPGDDDKKTAVLVLPHWNAKEGTYFDLCRFFNKVGVSSLRLTLPYHEERRPPELERADYLVAPNVGRTLQSLRQSVIDTRAAVQWLKQQGYEKVGLIGTSIGSCVGFFAFVHDENIDAGVFNHVSGYVADVVWEGLSTYHVKEGMEGHIELDKLREYWLPISPMAYMDKLKESKPRPQRYIYTLYDLTFPISLTKQMMDALDLTGVKHDKVVIPCGHYTLGEKPWVWIDGFKIISFLRKHLKK